MSLAQRTRSLVYVPRPPPVLRSPAQGLMAGCIQERFTRGFWSEVGSLDVLVLTYCTAVSLPGEGVKAVRFPGVGKSHTQSRHQWWMENHSSTLIPGGQVYRGDRPNALTIQDDVLGTYTIPGEARGHGPLADMWQRERGSQTPVS